MGEQVGTQPRCVLLAGTAALSIGAAAAGLAMAGCEQLVCAAQRWAHWPGLILTLGPAGRRKLRLCWDGRPVNEQIPCPKFKFETVGVAAKMMRPNDYMFVIDSELGADGMVLSMALGMAETASAGAGHGGMPSAARCSLVTVCSESRLPPDSSEASV